jgi:hypothetical protein
VVGLHLHFGTSMPVEKGGVHTITLGRKQIPSAGPLFAEFIDHTFAA